MLGGLSLDPRSTSVRTWLRDRDCRHAGEAGDRSSAAADRSLTFVSVVHPSAFIGTAFALRQAPSSTPASPSLTTRDRGTHDGQPERDDRARLRRGPLFHRRPRREHRRQGSPGEGCDVGLNATVGKGCTSGNGAPSAPARWSSRTLRPDSTCLEIRPGLSAAGCRRRGADAAVASRALMTRNRCRIVTVVGARPNFMKVGAHSARADEASRLLRAAARTYRTALRSRPLTSLLRRARDRSAGRHARRRLAQPCPADRGDHGGVRIGAAGLVRPISSSSSATSTRPWRARWWPPRWASPVAHVEAGLRSFDRSMPEEINRVLTDHLADFLFATEASALENLRREGIPDERVHFVGNVMIDTLFCAPGAGAQARGACPARRPERRIRPADACTDRATSTTQRGSSG